ncbi:hypothetical protein LKL35_27345 [Streptomyces sp. ET3-23]|uniref:hypothetical protein n=1 Tax=Streptomyces sp. ET3-23 TaxID=2885643 RepID=UPI001D0FB2DE|nr:hypothetical protein [Streptomyces sp. ET3-23]MCC2279113.1 hypothetical protein [Streptomyces sp. ET3-23]
MHRHAIPPARFFSQVPNEIIRHPRLSSDAVRLLLWQLSLPDSASEPLYESAQRAGIKKAAFNRAKGQLLTEGYLHEWRRQDGSGRWSRPQVISNVPLTADEAIAVRDGHVREPLPTAPKPAVGEPSPRAVGRSPENTEGNTSHHPSHPLSERGAQALAAVAHGERRLRLSGRDLRQLAPLAGEWLLRGATLADLREALTSGLPERVHSPAGITRNRLERKMPDPAPEPTAAPNPLRACSGPCGRVFRPAVDEERCRDCRRAAAAAPYDTSASVAATRRGMAAVREALSLTPHITPT